MSEQRLPSLFAAARPNVGRPKKQAAESAAIVGDGNDGDDAASSPVK